MGKKNGLLILLFLLGLSCQVFGQTPAKDFEGSWQGTLEAGGQKLRLAVTVTKSDAGVYAGKLDSLDQGATIPIDTITVNGDAVRLGDQVARDRLRRRPEQRAHGVDREVHPGRPTAPAHLEAQRAGSRAPPPKPKPDYSAPADAPYIAEEVVVKTPAGHTLAGTLTLPKSASRANP